MNPLQRLNYLLGHIMRGLITLYQHTISPDKGVFSPWLKGKVCSHEPHCSKYGKECFERYGFWPGVLYTIDRVSSCTPKMSTQYDPSHYKVVFFSSAPIGVPFLEELAHDKRFEVVWVVTAPDRASGRGLEVKPNVIKEAAINHIKNDLCRYFLLVDSLQKDRKEQLKNMNITRSRREDRWIIIYSNVEQHSKILKLLQGLLNDGARYFDTRWAHSLIVYKHKYFDLRAGENEPAKEYGRSIGIPEVQLDRSTESNEKVFEEMIQTPEKINPEKSDEWKEFTEWLISKDADFFVVIAYGKIMPQSILDIPKVGPINVHPSLLPSYRGASPIISALKNNETMTGITIIYMDAKMDEGDELAKLGFSMDFSRTEEDLTKKMTQIWPEFLCNTLRDFGKEHLGRTPQDHEHATYCTKIAKEEGEIDPWHTPLGTLYNKYRAYYTRPKIYFMHNNKRVIIEKLIINKKLFDANALLVNSTTHALHESVEECMVKPEGKKAMTRDEFTRWYLAL